MTLIDFSKSKETSSWPIGIAESHNADHRKIEQLIGIVGITLPQLISLETARLDQNFFSQKNIRVELTQILSMGVMKLTMGELKKIPTIVWKLNSPDQEHFQVFFPDQVHQHPGLGILESTAWSEFRRRTAKLIYQKNLSPLIFWQVH